MTGHGQFSADGTILDGPAGPIAVATPVFVRDGEDHSAAHGRTRAQMSNLAEALNAGSALLDVIENNPTLFFGMEDTCYFEFRAFREALAKVLA